MQSDELDFWADDIFTLNGQNLRVFKENINPEILNIPGKNWGRIIILFSWWLFIPDLKSQIYVRAAVDPKRLNSKSDRRRFTTYVYVRTAVNPKQLVRLQQA